MIDLESDIKTAISTRQGQVVIKRTQDYAPYLDENKRELAAFQARRNAPRRKVAEIPNIIVEQWMKQGVNIFDRNHAKKVQELLNSNEYQFLRTSPGKCKIV
jgi:hypothetical protein